MDLSLTTRKLIWLTALLAFVDIVVQVITSAVVFVGVFTILFAIEDAATHILNELKKGDR